MPQRVQFYVVTLLCLLFSFLFPRIEKLFYHTRLDLLSRTSPPPASPELYWIGIDDESADHFGGWPLKPEAFSKILIFLEKANVANLAVAIPPTLLSPSTQELFDKYPFVLKEQEGTPIPIPPGGLTYPLEGFAVLAALKSEHFKSQKMVPLPSPLWINYRPNPREPILGASGLGFQAYVEQHENDHKAHERFRGKTILIIPYSKKHGVLVNTPIGKYLPVGILDLNVINMMLTEKWIRSASTIQIVVLWLLILSGPHWMARFGKKIGLR